LIADVTPPEDRGRAFGFIKAMDKAGGFIGIVLAAALVYFTQRDAIALTWETYQWLVLLAVLPGLAAVAIVAKWVEERPAAPAKLSARLLMSELGGRFWTFIGILTLFTLGNSSDAFLMLRAQTLGLSLVEIFLLVAVFSLVISVTSTKGGALSDTVGRRGLIIVGWLIYAAVYFGLGYASAEWHMWVLYAVYGLYYGAFQGASSALVADLVPQHLRGTAYGVFNGALGIAAFPASVIAGLLWDWHGASAPFYFGGAISLVAVVGFLIFLPAVPKR
jgi:MFS family permease